MAKIIDERLAYDIELVRIIQQPNAVIPDVDGEPGDVVYVVRTKITYYLLGEDGNRLTTKSRVHDLYPLANPITSVQYINNQTVLAPLIKAAAIADRIELTNPE